MGDGGSLDDQDEAYLDFDDDDHDSDNDDAYDDDENDDMDSRIANAMAENSLSLDGKYKAREYIPGLCDGDDFDDDLVDAASDSNQSPTNKNRDSNHQPNYRLVSSSTIGMTCSGCGSPFQSKNVLRPGFLPSDIFAKEDDRLRTLKREGVISGSVEIGGEGGGEEAADWSADDEVDWLVNGAQQQQEQQEQNHHQQPTRSTRDHKVIIPPLRNVPIRIRFSFAEDFPVCGTELEIGQNAQDKLDIPKKNHQQSQRFRALVHLQSGTRRVAICRHLEPGRGDLTIVGTKPYRKNPGAVNPKCENQVDHHHARDYHSLIEPIDAKTRKNQNRNTGGEYPAISLPVVLGRLIRLKSLVEEPPS